MEKITVSNILSSRNPVSGERRFQKSRRSASTLAAALVSCTVLAPSAWATTYVYVGQTYDNLTNVTPAPSTAGDPPDNYTKAMKVTGRFTTDARLPGNLNNVDIGPSGTQAMKTWSFTDGLVSYDQSNSVIFYQNTIHQSLFSTDGNGNITQSLLGFLDTPPPYTPSATSVKGLTVYESASSQSITVQYFVCSKPFTPDASSCYMNSNAPANTKLKFVMRDRPGQWSSFDGVDDSGSAQAGSVTQLPSVVANDQVGGLSAVLGSNAIISQVGTWPQGITLDPQTGAVHIDSSALPGNPVMVYQLCDAQSPEACVPVNVTINITAPPPVAQNGTATGAAHQPITGNVVTGGGSTTAVLQAAPSHGTVTLNPDGSYAYTSSGNFTGVDTFTFLLDGGSAGKSNVATVTITVTPTATADTFSTQTNQVLSVPGPGVLANDVANNGTVTVKASTTNGTLVMKPDGGFDYTPKAGFTGIDSFTYFVTDAAGQSGDVTVTITVAGVRIPTEPTNATSVPTLNEWGVLSMSALLAVFGFFGVRRRKS